MAKDKYYAIRWRDEDSRELSRVVKNFNAKITRLAKQDPANARFLPEKVSVSDLKDVIKSRSDFNREIKSLQRFTQRPKGKGKSKQEDLVSIPGNDNNIMITRWQKNEMVRRSVGVNRRRKNRLDQLMESELVYKTNSLGYKIKDIGLGKNELNQLKPIKVFTPSQTQKDVHKKFKTIRKESSEHHFLETDNKLKENFLKAIKEQFPQDDPRVKELIDVISKSDPKRFYDVWRSSGGTFEYAYPPSKETIQSHLDVLMKDYGKLK